MSAREPANNTNLAEGFHLRIKRAEKGIHHRIADKYLDRYAAELAWREDRRRTDFRTQARRVLAAALAHPVSRNMAGYWQSENKAERALVGWNPLSGMKATGRARA